MPVDPSIYQIQRPMEMPSPLDSMGKAMSLGNMAREGQLTDLKIQEAKAAQGMSAQKVALENHQRVLGAISPVMEHLASLPPDQRGAQYPGFRDQLIKGGLIKPEDAPPALDDGWFNNTLLSVRSSKEYLDRQHTMAQTGLAKAETAKNWADAGKAKSDSGGKQLAAEQTDKLAGHQAAMSLIGDVRQALQNNTGDTGPLMGRLAGANPWNTRGQELNALLKKATQVIGKSLEGGKLTDRDYEKYQAMLPTQNDTPEVAAGKLDQLERMVGTQNNSDIDAFGKAGLNVSKFAQAPLKDINVTKPAKGGGLIESAQAGQVTSHPQDAAAVEWARSNPKDPRSAQILQLNGAKQ